MTRSARVGGLLRQRPPSDHRTEVQIAPKRQLARTDPRRRPAGRAPESARTWRPDRPPSPPGSRCRRCRGRRSSTARRRNRRVDEPRERAGSVSAWRRASDSGCRPAGRAGAGRHGRGRWTRRRGHSGCCVRCGRIVSGAVGNTGLRGLDGDRVSSGFVVRRVASSPVSPADRVRRVGLFIGRAVGPTFLLGARLVS